MIMEGCEDRVMRGRLVPASIVAGVLLAVAIVAAVNGPVRIGDPMIDLSFLESNLEFEEPGDEGDLDPPPPGRDEASDQSNSLLSRILGLVFTILLYGALAFVLWKVVKALLRVRPNLAAPDQDAVVIDTLRQAADQEAELLASIQPGVARDGVVACWVRLERAAATAGNPRAAQQTPTEFTASLLTSFEADENAVGTLLALYHRARFSSAPVPAAAAAEASAALRRISATLTQPRAATAPSADPPADPSRMPRPADPPSHPPAGSAT
jgi:hypothetical protein